LTEIKATLAERKGPIFNKYPIQSLAIFGSFARNEQNDDSELDLVVEFNGKIGSDLILFAVELESYLGFKVDLVSRKGIKDRYFQTIKSDLIYV
jgi:predicted nucleotidyltransferase